MKENRPAPVRLEHTDAEMLRDAFAGLPRRGMLEVRCAWARRQRVSDILESMGAFALRIDPLPGFADVLVSAIKGKEGACFDTGRRARYTGSARAVVDDDGHLLSGWISVCEKTALLYRLPPYEKLVEVTVGDSGLLARLDSDPAPFACGTLAAAVEAFAAAPLPNQSMADEPRRVVLYPGPFRWLIARDGSLIRRGRVCSLPADVAREMEASDGLVTVPAAAAGSARPAPFFADEFARRGGGCLSEPETQCADSDGVGLDGGDEHTVGREPDWDALRAAPDELCDRMRRLLKENESYFVLSGSDPRNPLGCCPSTLVGAANRLVEAGILCRRRMPAPAGACEASAYAFAPEARSAAGEAPQFYPDPDFRRCIARRLDGAARRAKARWSMLVRAGLLALAGVGFLLAIHRTLLPGAADAPAFEEALALALDAGPADSRLFVCVFRGREDCEACEAMLRLSRRTVDDYFADARDEGRLAFREIRFDLPRHRAIRDRLGLAMNTVGLIRYAEGRPQSARLLTRRVWMLHGDEPVFLDMLRQEIDAFLAEVEEEQP